MPETAPPTPTAELEPTPSVITPVEAVGEAGADDTPANGLLTAQAGVVTAELGQPFILWDEQRVELPAEALTIAYDTVIEWECGEDEECEVPLLTHEEWQAQLNGSELPNFVLEDGRQQAELGEYVLLPLRRYQGYAYESHHFEYVLAVESAEQAAAYATGIEANNPLDVTQDCAFSVYDYRLGHSEEDEQRVHMLSLRRAAREFDPAVEGMVDVHVARTDEPITLVLASQATTAWRITAADGVSLARIFLSGQWPQTAEAPAGVEVVNLSPDESFGGGETYEWRYSAAYRYDLAPAWVAEIEAAVGSPLDGFTACEQATQFTLR